MSDGYKGFYLNGIEQWSQFFERSNWYTFHPIKIEFEDDRHLGGAELTVVVLGLGFRLRWNYAETDDYRSIKKMAEEVLDDPATPQGER